MKTFVIERKTWRCGGTGDNKMGEGFTALENFSGYRCCLGQIIRQIDPSINIVGFPTPVMAEKYIPLLTTNINGISANTELANKAMDINDDPLMTNEEREKKLKELFEGAGIKLEFVDVVNQEIEDSKTC